MKSVANKVCVGFMSGLISAMILFVLFTFMKEHTMVLNAEFKQNLYRLMVWGGVWAILFILPLSKNIFIKSSIIGITVILFNFLVKMPLAGQGFFAINAGMSAFMTNITFNYLWCLLAGIIYIAITPKEA